MSIRIIYKDFLEPEVEVVERKGVGHPDTLADGLAEYFSRMYSRYTKRHFGRILHHNFDKTAILGGQSGVAFGRGVMTDPIRVLINGRASYAFGKVLIPVEKLLQRWTEKYFRNRFSMLDTEHFLDIRINLSYASSPGKVNDPRAVSSPRQRWFAPRSLKDLPEATHLRANDTSLGVGYAPRSKLEKLVMSIEQTLTGPLYRQRNRWMGTDVKVLGVRIADEFAITLCVPQIADYVPNVRTYSGNLQKVFRLIQRIAYRQGVRKIQISMNTRDKTAIREIYLTAIGSSIESGDEGVVGRGNRVNGLITPMRLMSLEGASGKNPVYHIGKLYNVLAFQIAATLHRRFGVPTEVILASQSGRDLLDPWFAVVTVPKDFDRDRSLVRVVRSKVKGLPKVTEAIIAGNVRLS